MSKIARAVKEHIFLIPLGILAFFLRAQEVLSNNYLFLLDQGRDMMAVKKIVFEHDLVFIGPNTSLSGVFQGPLYYYLLAPLTIVFKGDPIGAMITMLAVSLTVVFVVYFFFYSFFGKVHALVAAYLFTISPEAVAAATYIWNPHPMWLLIVLSILLVFLIRVWSQKFHLLLWPVILLTFHFQMAFGVFLLLSVSLYFVIVRTSLSRKIYIVRGLAAASLLLLPQILFDIRNNFLMTRSVLQVVSGASDQGLFAAQESLPYQSLMDTHMHALAIHFKSGLPQFGAYQNYPIALLLVSLFAAFWFLYKGKLSNREKILLHVTSVLFILIFALTFAYPFPLRYWFLTGMQSLYLIFMAIPISALIRAKTIILRIAALILLVVTIPYAADRLQTRYQTEAGEVTPAKIQGKIQAFDYIYEDAGDEPFGLLVFTPPVLTDAYDYIQFWYASPTYGYTPHQDKRGTVYLLMEPDPEKPWSYNGWLETVIVDGKVLSEKTLASGIIVQKRVFGKEFGW